MTLETLRRFPMNTLTVARKIRRHYGLTRPVTEPEVHEAIAMLKRRRDDLDQSMEALAATLQTGPGAIDLWDD